MANNLVFKIIDAESQDHNRLVLLCEKVFSQSPNLVFAKKNSQENQEKSSQENHIFIAAFLDGNLCATATLTPEDDKFFMEKVAVKSDLQNKGIGSMLLKFCEEFASENQGQVIYCCVRETFGKSALNFYLKNEYYCAEDEVMENGLPHKLMWKKL